MSKLYMMMGAPGCGKTTLAKQIFPDNVKYISRDEIRYKTILLTKKKFTKNLLRKLQQHLMKEMVLL